MRQRNSFWGVLGQSADVAPGIAIETVRLAMRFAVEAHCSPSAKALDDQIGSAEDFERLWYLLPEVIVAITVRRGEDFANDYGAQIARLFNGNEPKANEMQDTTLCTETKQSKREIRLCWIANRTDVIGCEQVESGPWVSGTVAFRGELQKNVDAGVAANGVGSYWIQEREQDGY